MSKKLGASPKAISPINTSSQALYAHKGARTNHGVVPKLSGVSTKAAPPKPVNHPDESAKMARTGGDRGMAKTMAKGCTTKK